MRSPLQKTSRREVRVRVGGSCLVNSMKSPQVYLAKMNDISHTGLSFFLEESVFPQRSVLQIKIRTGPSTSTTLTGLVIHVPEPQTLEAHIIYRYSIQFEQRLSDRIFKQMVDSFEVLTYER